MAAVKLTTIVAIDIARYSALAQADEEAAVAAVARLHRRCVKAVADHDGRIFSTAGDAVMLEFSSVSGGLEAATELAADPDPPIRVGVHLGEVTVQENGDLLGHGVNVAARLQQQTRVGSVLVSEDARRALRGPLAKRLVAKGVIKLNKIDESIGVYELSGEDATVAPPIATWPLWFSTPRRLVAIGAAFAVLLAAGLGWFLWPRAEAAPRVAVYTLETPSNDEELARVAQGIGEDVQVALNALGVQTISGDDTELEPALLSVDGVVERVGADMRITLAITRGRERASLWSTAITMPAENIRGARTRAAEESADVLSCGVRALRRKSSLDTEALAGFLRGCQKMRGSPLEARDALIPVVERTPDFALARGVLAIVSIQGSDDAPESMRAAMLEQAREHAERAIRQDSSVGESYIALSLLAAYDNNWAERERLLREALDRDGLNAHAHNFYANLMHETGRIEEAAAYAERSVTLDPLSLPKRRVVGYLLLLNNEADRSRSILLAKTWPDDATLWRARARTALWSEDYAGALALLNEPAAPTGQARRCWQETAHALQAGAVSIRIRQQIRDCDGRGFPADLIVAALTAIGDLDGAFEVAGSDVVLVTYVAYAPVAAPLRADARFMPLMKEIGLLAYWRESGQWPDFCRDPSLPYDCQAEAERLL